MICRLIPLPISGWAVSFPPETSLDSLFEPFLFPPPLSLSLGNGPASSLLRLPLFMFICTPFTTISSKQSESPWTISIYRHGSRTYNMWYYSRLHFIIYLIWRFQNVRAVPDVLLLWLHGCFQHCAGNHVWWVAGTSKDFPGLNKSMTPYLLITRVVVNPGLIEKLNGWGCSFCQSFGFGMGVSSSIFCIASGPYLLRDHCSCRCRWIRGDKCLCEEDLHKCENRLGPGDLPKRILTKAAGTSHSFFFLSFCKEIA